MTEKDEKILRHIGRHRVSLRPVLRKLFFDGNETACGNVIKRLLDDGRIRSIGGLADKFHYYMLTSDEARRQGVPVDRAKDLNAQGLLKWVSVVWFCCIGERRRYLLDNNELQKLFGHAFKVPYCLEEPRGNEGARIYRVFTPGGKTNPRTLISEIQAHLDEVRELPPAPGAQYNIADMMKERMYAVAILVDSDERRARLQALVNDEESGLKALTKVIVETVASPSSVPRAINEKPTPPTPGANSSVSTRSAKRRGKQHR